MLEAKAIQPPYGRYLVPGILLLVLLAALPLPAAAQNLSGDAPYDPAAGSHPALFVFPAAASYSGNDAYDPAAGGYPILYVGAASANLSGDDAYDPAAGGLSALAGNVVEEPFCAEVELEGVGSYSGDDVYDAAAGGRPEILPRALACAE